MTPTTQPLPYFIAESVADVSTPAARPVTTPFPASASPLAISAARERPALEAFLDPTTEKLFMRIRLRLPRKYSLGAGLSESASDSGQEGVPLMARSNVPAFRETYPSTARESSESLGSKRPDSSSRA